MNRVPLKAEEREVLGKKVARLRQAGFIPGHVFGKGLETEHVSVNLKDFLKAYDTVGETGLVDLKIGAEKVRPVLVREVQVDPVRGSPLHIDFYQVNLSVKVSVPVPIELIGDEPELVHTGEAVVIQPMSEVEVEALPAELPEKIVVDISKLRQIDDAITVAELNVPVGVTVLAEPDAVVVKLDSAVTAEMQQLLAEQEAEAAAAVAEAPVVGEEAPAPGEEAAEVAEVPTEGEEDKGEKAEAGDKDSKDESSEEK